jgi:hypothetical protein
MRIHPRSDGHDDRKKTLGVGHEPIGIGDDPFTLGVTAHRGFNGWDRNVDAVRAASGLAGQAAQVEAITTSGIEIYVVSGCGQNLRDGVQQRPAYAAIMQSPPRSNGRDGVARLVRSAVLRLEQVDVSAARHVEGMPALTKQPLTVAGKRQAAITDRADQHASSVTDAGPSIG